MEIRGKRYDRRARRKLCFMVMQDTGNQLFTESDQLLGLVVYIAQLEHYLRLQMKQRALYRKTA